MSAKSIEFEICGHCGSTEYLEDYPVPGTSICTKCANEITRITLRELPEEEIIQQPCPYCGKEGEEDDTLYEDARIIIFKCKGCGKLDGYTMALEPTYADSEWIDDGDFGGKAVAIAKTEGHPIYSASPAKKIAKALRKREKEPKEKCKKQMNALFHEKNQKMQQSGISSETIKRAKLELTYFVERKGPFTDKQLESLLSAAISLAQDDLIRMGRLDGTKITQREMKEILNVDRKTIRKWKKILKEDRKPLRIKVRVRQSEGEPADSWGEIPKELKLVVKLEEPYKGECDMCRGIKLLSWRIQYINGSWSDICESDYGLLKIFSLEYEWKIENCLR